MQTWSLRLMLCSIPLVQLQAHSVIATNAGHRRSPVQIVEELGEPPHHDAVICPSGVQLLQQELAVLAPETRQHLLKSSHLTT